jgi:hypothetical protein
LTTSCQVSEKLTDWPDSPEHSVPERKGKDPGPTYFAGIDVREFNELLSSYCTELASPRKGLRAAGSSRLRLEGHSGAQKKIPGRGSGDPPVSLAGSDLCRTFLSAEW